MGKLGYWQECDILRISDERSCDDNGKRSECRYLELDISARDANTGRALNKRFLVVKVVNKKLVKFLLGCNFPTRARLRLFASGFRDRERANRLGASLDVFECIIINNEN